MTVSLRDVVLAVRYGDAALVGESAGYAILGAADLALRSRQLATMDSVSVTADGAVTLDGSSCSAEEAEAGLRALLGLLLGLVRTPAPNLARVSARATANGLLGLVQELEAALVPVNRKAARRTLARLERETKKSAARGRQLIDVEPVPVVQAELPPLVPSPLPAPAQYQEPAVHFEAEPVYAQPEPVAWQAEPHAWPAPASVQPEPAHQFVRAPESSFQQAPRSEPSAPGSRAPASLAHVSKMAQAAVWGSQIPDIRDADLASAAGFIPPGPPPVAVQEVKMRPRLQVTAAPAAPEIYMEPDVFYEDDDLDEVPTQVFVGVMAPVSEPAQNGSLALERAPRPAPLRRRAPYVARPKRVIADDVCLVSSSRMAQKRRPSDISDLLDKMWVEPQSPDEVFQGLKSLSRVEVSPLAPPVAAALKDGDSRAPR